MNLSRSNHPEIREAVEAMSLLPSSADIATRGLEKFKQTVESTGVQTQKSVGLMESVFAGIGPSIVAAIQGGGDILRSAGSTMGLNLANEFVKKFGDSVKSLLGNVLGGAINSLIPGLGSLLNRSAAASPAATGPAGVPPSAAVAAAAAAAASREIPLPAAAAAAATGLLLPGGPCCCCCCLSAASASSAEK